MALLVKEFFWMIAPQPLLQEVQMVWLPLHICHGNLVGTEGILDGNAIDLFRPGPALRSTQDNGRPSWLSEKTILAGFFLIATNLGIAGIQCLGKSLMHAHGVIPLNEVDLVAMTSNETLYPLVVSPSQNRRTRNLVSIEMENRQNGPVANWVQEGNTFP
jgi:hypothetical protein